jgi:hypothetical protein
MNNMRLSVALLLGLAFAADLWAVSLVETKREEGTDTTYVHGYRMLITGFEGGGRMVMDLEKKQTLMINDRSKSVVDMSEAAWKALGDSASQELPKVDARLENLGAGPKIAGYETVHYVIYADGKKCAEKWTSKEALEDTGLDEVWEEFGDFLEAANVDPDSHPCELAEFQTFRFNKQGFALKEIDHNCETSEVLRIERGVDFDTSAFEIPGDYKVVKFPVSASNMNYGSTGWGEWEGMDCSRDPWGNPAGVLGGDYMDEEYLDDEYADEEYMDDEYADEAYLEEDYNDESDMADEEDDEAEDGLEEKLKGFMSKFRKKDKKEDEEG